jgi:TP901 family phage tail tape measure protein
MVDITNAVVVQIAADVSRLASGMEQADSLVQRFSQTTQQLGQRVTAFGGQMTQAFGPLADYAEQAISSFAGFDSVMTDIQLYGGVAADQMGMVEAAARAMAQTTMFSATQAGNAILEFTKGGYGAADAMEMAAAAAKLATVGDLDMAQAAGLLTTSMAQFNLTSADTNNIIEALARAAGASRADVADLADGMSNVGPTAARMGLDLDTVVAILATFSDAGMQGAEGGTQLRSMLMNLYQPTESVKSALRSLNLSLYDTDENLRPLSAVFDDLQERMSSGEYTAKELNDAFSALFGAFGGSGASALVSAGGWDEMTRKMEAATSAADIFAGKQDTLAFKMSQLENAKDTLTTVFGEAVADTISPVIETLTDKLTGLSAWVTENPGIAGAFGALAIGLTTLGAVALIVGPIIAGIGKIVAVGGTLITGLTALPAALAPIALPALLVAAAIFTIVGALRSPLLGEGLQSIVDGFGNLAESLGLLISGDLQGAAEKFATGMGNIVTGIAAIAAAPVDGMIAILNDLGLTDWTGLKDAIAGIGAIFTNLPIVISLAVEDLKQAGDQFTAQIGLIYADILQRIQDSPGLTALIGIFNPDMAEVFRQLETAGIGVGDTLKTSIENDMRENDFVAAIEAELNAQMAAGVVDVDTKYISTNRFGESVSTSLRASINEVLTRPEFSDDVDSSIYTAMANALALASGHEDYQLLFDAAKALEIYGEVLPPIKAYMQEALSAGFTVDVPVFLNPIINTGMGVTPPAGNIAQAFNGVPGPGDWGYRPNTDRIVPPPVNINVPPAGNPKRIGGKTITGLATGGSIQRDGLFYLHAGEAVLNRRETQQGGRASQFVINNYSQDTHQLAALVERALRDRGR